MSVPAALRKQFAEYERAGFHVVSAEPRAGSHWKVIFQEFTEPQFLTINSSDTHALRNNIARFRRLVRGTK